VSMSCAYSYRLRLLFTRMRLFFFFSSRRRHTRLVSDWSSDVCSSDLTDLEIDAMQPARASASAAGVNLEIGTFMSSSVVVGSWRSEERRVGKECRSRWSRYH